MTISAEELTDIVRASHGVYPLSPQAVQRLIAEIRRLQGLMEWQPIETAPKDGTEILAWIPKDEEAHVIWWSGHKNKIWLQWGNNREFKPSHWMPLPAPPKQQKDEGVRT